MSRSRKALAAIGPVVGPLLGIGRIKLTGNLPNGQEFRIAPRRVWAVADSSAVVCGEDLGPIGPHPVQGNLADFQFPQRGICVVAQGRFEAFDVAGIATATVLTYPADPPMTLAQNRHMSSRQTPPDLPTRAEVLAALSVAIDLGLGSLPSTC